MLKLKIVSPERVVYDDIIDSIVVPGTLGQFEILENHAPIISTLEKGQVRFRTPQGEQTLDITTGFVTVKKNQVNVCVEVAG
ncbi:MAG: ATP synthase F1 subunit epsilon [Prevotella sp.]|nr:ATP synthase F1 subunit epsilon [Prevotella sp.]MDY5034147.1 ATP synthase F1 subunit epsilon [Prevotella sp.]